MLFEVHDNRNPPETCRGDYVSSEVVTQVWIDDAEIAEHLRTRYSMPVSFAAIEMQFNTSSDVEQYSATFTPEGGVTSSIQEVRPHDSSTSTVPLTYRRFWTNSEGGISFMDFTDESTVVTMTPPLVYGEIHEPFLYANLGTSTYAAYGGFYQGGYIDAPIQQFRDLACTEPL